MSFQKEFDHLLPHIRYFESAVTSGNVVEQLTEKGYTVTFVKLTIQALRRLDMKVGSTPPGLKAKIRLHLKRLDGLNSHVNNMYAEKGRQRSNTINGGWYDRVRATLTQALAHATKGEKELADATLEYASHMLDFLPPQNAFKEKDIQALRQEIQRLRRTGTPSIQMPKTPQQKKAYVTQIQEYVDATHKHKTVAKEPVKLMTPGTAHVTTTAYPLILLLLLVGAASMQFI